MEQTARLALSLLDLTSLNETDGDDEIRRLCHRARTPAGPPAAVCVPGRLVAQASASLVKLGLRDQVRVATVVNFPAGTDPIEDVVLQIRSALTSGADEIDLVFPYQDLLAGDENSGYRLINRCRQISTGYVLKVILETGELKTPQLVRTASEIALSAGADFLKTSTGKVAVNATPEAAAVMMETIRDSGRPVGFKAAGGIRTVRDAAHYLDLGESILGPAWLRPERFRFGASGLLDDILSTLGFGIPPVHLGTGY